MIPLSVTLRSDLLILIEVIFWIFVPVSFVCVGGYALKQNREGTLIGGPNAPLPIVISSMGGWLYVLGVLGLIFFQSALYIVFVLIGTFGLFIESGNTISQQFGFSRIKPFRIISWSLLVFGAVMLIEAPLTELITWFLKTAHLPDQEQETVETFRHLDSPATIFQFIVLAAFLLPIFEELFFRGFLQGFLKKYTSTWGALFFTSGIFAFAHLNLAAALPLWVLGLVLGIAYENTGCLLLPIGIHACWNFVTALSILLDKGNP
jgi:membrane protease YdiL (CAAX protease family)